MSKYLWKIYFNTTHKEYVCYGSKFQLRNIISCFSLFVPRNNLSRFFWFLIKQQTLILRKNTYIPVTT